MAVAKGGDLPKALQDRPLIPSHLMSLWGAFLFASSSRPQNGFVIARIPPTEIEAVLRMQGIDDPEDMEDWVYLIARLDAELVEIRQKEADEEAEAAKRGAKKPARSKPRA